MAAHLRSVNRPRQAFALVAVLVVVAPTLPAAAATGAGPASATADATGSVDGIAGESTDGRVQPCSYPVTITDATGTEVTIEEEPQEVVTMAPGAAQTAWDIGAREKIVGVSQLAGYLEGAEEKANISAPGFGSYNVERMVALDPDVVIAPNVIQNRTVSQVRQAGLKVVRLEEAQTVEDVKDKTGVVGQLTGECHGAAVLVDWMEQNLEEVRGAVATVEQPRAIYVTSGFAAGDDTFINDMIGIAGARNVVAEAGVSGYNPVNEEVVADRDPQWIVLSNPRSTVPQEAPYNSTTAGQEGNVLQINPNYISQPAPRSVVFAVRNMTEAFHPEAFEDAQFVPLSEVRAASTTTTTTTTTTTEPTTSTTTTEATGTTEAMDGDGGSDGTDATTGGDDGDGGGGVGQPGFGPLVGIVALLAALGVLARRR